MPTETRTATRRSRPVVITLGSAIQQATAVVCGGRIRIKCHRCRHHCRLPCHNVDRGEAPEARLNSSLGWKAPEETDLAGSAETLTQPLAPPSAFPTRPPFAYTGKLTSATRRVRTARRKASPFALSGASCAGVQATPDEVDSRGPTLTAVGSLSVNAHERRRGLADLAVSGEQPLGVIYRCWPHRSAGLTPLPHAPG